ncbi:MAG: SET domain-containing protein [Akkermansiaceae bacterium]|nr:SET domain-containing protein [Akkermansiaceae bacterium]
MIHPSTELRLVDAVIGYGVFATKYIPRGTVIYAQDALELRVLPDAFSELNAECKSMVDKYSFIDPRGARVLSWDFAKYVNHRCECNTMSTGWGFEIAIHDILEGDEITDDYGLFNLEYDMEVSCGCTNCRGVVRGSDVDTYYREWDRKIRRALLNFNHVEQPLLSHLGDDVRSGLNSYFRGESPYLSVRELKYTPAVEELARVIVA